MSETPMELTVCDDCAAAVPQDRLEEHKKWHTNLVSALAKSVKADLDKKMREAVNMMRLP
jgi:biotin synthase-related radical SAM superfamily protein